MAMDLYRCVDGDRIDLIVLKYYGTVKPLKRVIEANPKLPKEKSLILKSGMIINLPKIEESNSFSIGKDGKEEELLW